MPYYKLHGLQVSSCTGLPDAPSEPHAPDVVIRRARIDAPDPDGQSGARWFHAASNMAGLVQQGVGAVVIRNGREVLFDPAPGADEDRVLHLLRGPAMAIVLQQRGALPLHASAVLMDGAAVVFPGHTGSGKSVLAAALSAHGHGVLADDIVALQANGAEPQVFPGSPTIRLHQAGVDFLEHAGLLRENDGRPCQEKLAFQGRAVRLAGPVAVKAFYVQSEGEREGIEPMSPQEALIQTLRYTYANEFYSLVEGRKAHFLKSSQIARHARFYRLCRGRESRGLSRLLRMLEEHYHEL